MRKEMRGISPLIATLILVAATVAGGAIVYSVMQGQASRLGGGANLEITNADIIVAGSARLATVTVRNTGSVNLTSVTATITVDSGSAASIDLGSIAPGTSASGENTSGSWTAGKAYIVKVAGTAADGSTVTRSVSVIARG